MKHSIPSAPQTNDVQLRALVSYQCDFMYEGSFRHSFASVCSAITDPRISAIYFSVNGNLYPRNCLIIPITQSIQIKCTYPFLHITDGSTSVCLKFSDLTQIVEFNRFITTKVRENIREHLSAETIYKVFFPAQVVASMLPKLPPISNPKIFGSQFRLSQGETFEDPTAISMLMQNERWFRTYTDMSLIVVTWNIDSRLPPEANLNDLTGSPDRQYDIVVFCLQEIDMDANNVMKGKSPERSAAWAKALQASVSLNGSYSVIGSHQLGTCFIIAFIRQQFEKKATDVATGEVCLGSMGFYNKSAVALRFSLDDTKLCFVDAHLAHGKSNSERRNAEIAQVLDEMVFHTQNGDMKIEDHDAIIVAGGLNYGLDLPSSESRARFQDIPFLIQHDQLIKSIRNNSALVGFTEGQIKFLPTCKFDRNTTNLDTVKQRGPSYCDRIFYCLAGANTCLTQREYSSIRTLLISDHHAVYSTFDLRYFKNDIEKARKLYEEVKSKLQALRWSAKLNEDRVQFDSVKYDELTTKSVSLVNEGEIPVLFSVEPTPKWVQIHPSRGTVPPGSTQELSVQVHIGSETAKEIGPFFFENIRINFTSGHPPLSIQVTGSYLLSPVGLPLATLMRLPSNLSSLPANLFLSHNPDKLESKPIDKLPVCNSVPEEMKQLIKSLQSAQGDLFTETFSAADVLAVFEFLRTSRAEIPQTFTGQNVAAALTTFISSLPEALVPQKALEEVEGKSLMERLPIANKEVAKFLIDFLGGYLKKANLSEDRKKETLVTFTKAMIFPDQQVPAEVLQKGVELISSELKGGH